MKNLLDFGIETKIHYPIPLHLQECAYQLNYKIGDIPKAEFLAKSMISLPIYPELKEVELNYIVNRFNNIFKNLIRKSKIYDLLILFFYALNVIKKEVISLYKEKLC